MVPGGGNDLPVRVMSHHIVPRIAPTTLLGGVYMEHESVHGLSGFLWAIAVYLACKVIDMHT